MRLKQATLVIVIISVCLGAIVGWTAHLVSTSDTIGADGHIARWQAVNEDPSFKMLGPEDRIETILTFIVEGADYRPAQELVHALLVEAYSEIYAEGFVDCKEECERAIDDIHLMYTLTN